MARNVQFRIKVEIVETAAEPSAEQQPERLGEGQFSLVLPEADELNISALDRAALEVSFPALRDAVAGHLEQAGKKKIQHAAERHRERLTLRPHSGVYQVEGEIGRFTFPLYNALDEEDVAVYRGMDSFPRRQPREWHKTEGFRQEVVFLEVTQRSYRDTTAHLNRWRRQASGGTPYTTLQDNAEQEGTRVLNFLETQSEAILRAHGFDQQGGPTADAAVVSEVSELEYESLPEETVEQAWEQVRDDMVERGLSEEQVSKAEGRARELVYEAPTTCTNIHIDDVEVKKQRAHRRSRGVDGGVGRPPPQPAPAADRAQRRKRPKVSNTVARIEQGAKRFTLTGPSVGQVLCFVLAFLLNNGLLKGRLHVFADGQKSLQNAILSFFNWHPGFWLVLDWFHLVKKFKEELSLACRGRELRNQHLRTLVRLLWYGLVEEALQYLAAIPSSDLKNPKSIQRLGEYLVRNERAIPCYALRSQLGLRNASSPVESANNEVTARRQKRNGTSWSKEGSHAMTALSMVVCNHCCDTWVRDNVIPLEFINKAA